jgi:hypothetical protein
MTDEGEALLDAILNLVIAAPVDVAEVAHILHNCLALALSQVEEGHREWFLNRLSVTVPVIVDKFLAAETPRIVLN